MSLIIRPYHPSDLYSLYRICLLTGDNGKDASAQFRDPELLGHMFAAPYAVFEPDLCFILTRDGQPCGYVLGTRNSEAFGVRCARDWFPILRERYPLPPPEDASPDADLIRSIHAGYEVGPELAAYPAHLHIDLLPVAQGHGLGRRMIATFLAQLKRLGVPAVHLGVSAANTHAVGFYERLGFHRVTLYPDCVIYGMNAADFPC